MAGTVITTRITDKNFYFTRRNSSTGGVLKGDVFDVSKTYSSGWRPAIQRTSSYRSGVSFMKALSDPNMIVEDEDLRDRLVPDRSDQLLLRETNQAKQDTSFDRGHPFSTTKVEREFTTATLSSVDGNISYHGPLSVSFSNGLNSPFDGNVLDSGAPAIFASSDWPSIDLTYGAKAINKTIPTLPVAGVAAFLGELHEGLPKAIGHSLLFKERAHAFHGLGDEYLNYEFGWRPFVKDVKKLALAFQHAGVLLKTLKKNSGKNLRRHFVFPIIRDEKVYPSYRTDPQGFGGIPISAVLQLMTNNTVYGTFSQPEMATMIRAGTSATLNASYVRKQHYWFTGAFSYLLSEDDSFLGRMEGYVEKADKLFGIRLTPDVLWELTPWSWLADWEGNIGVNISNMTALGQDNLALRYGYLMRETSLNHYTSTSRITSYGGLDGPLHTTYRVTCKERVRSSPFGFGLSSAGFTDKQWAILGALGMTRAPKTLF